MLSLPNDGRYPTLELSPQQRRQKTLEALIAQVETLSRPNPVLIILEDAQWIDPTSLELFGRIVDRVPTLRVLLIVTFRPEFEPPWIGRPYVTALTINRLTERQVSAMIDRVVGNKLLPAALRQEIIERTDGIPLFVKEMTKAVLEAESEGDARQAPPPFHPRPWRCLRACTPRSWRGSTGSARLKRWRRSERRLGESSRTRYWLRWYASPRRS